MKRSEMPPKIAYNTLERTEMNKVRRGKAPRPHPGSGGATF